MWYREHCDVDFSEHWHLDPLYRGETLIRMRRELNCRFPALQLGGPNPEEAPSTLDGVHGALTISRIFGVGAAYYEDNWPAARHEYLSEAQITALEVPDLSANPIFAQIMEQADVIARNFGRIEGYINWQGVLNNAFRLRGDQIFLDLMLNPGLAHHLFEVVTQTMISGMKLLYARQRESGVEIRHATVSNCVVNMVSPDQYRDFVLPYDRTLSEAFDDFGIHNCAWNVDPYIEDYATIAKLGYVDMGLDSDLLQARRLCPRARRALMYKPTDLAGKSRDELRADLARIRRELSPCDIVMADIEVGTPDQRVMELAELVEEALAIEPEP
jgi:hypothetical protein